MKEGKKSVSALLLVGVTLIPCCVIMVRRRRRRMSHDSTSSSSSSSEEENVQQRRSKPPLPPPPSLPEGSYDAIIVGAGPAGSTLAYFLAKQSNVKRRVLLLERKRFPRVKYCGDAWCGQALDIMEEMEWEPGVSVLDEIERRGLCRPVQRGGFVSPFGHECVNVAGATYGSASKVRTYAIKRVVADEFLARAAERAGATLLEETEADVTNIKFKTDQGGHWHVPIKGEGRSYFSRVLVAADGATSYLSRHLGVVRSDADATCSHRYVRGGTHAFQADGVMFFNKAVLPGYSALFRHYNDDVYLGTYILPGGRATSRCIAGFEERLIDQHPCVHDAFGKKQRGQLDWRVDESEGENGRLKTAPIRCGGESKSYGDNFLSIGDAAGQTDPMTGEGIHTSMVAAKLAAKTIDEMFETNDFSESASQIYHARWKKEFGNDFVWSAAGAKLIWCFPILIDAACAYGIWKGQDFLDDFGLIMTGVKPKAAFLNPRLALPMSFFLLREVFLQHVMRKPPLVPQDIGQDLVEKRSQKIRMKNQGA